MKVQRTCFRHVVPAVLLAGLLVAGARSGSAGELREADEVLAGHAEDAGHAEQTVLPVALTPPVLEIFDDEVTPLTDVPPLPEGEYDPQSEYDYRAWNETNEWSPEAPFEYFEPSYYEEGEIPEEDPTLGWRLFEGAASIIERPIEPMAQTWERLFGAEHVQFESYIAEEAIGIQPIFPRVPLPLEWPERFLSMEDTLGQGIELPTGAIWRPTLWVFGVNRAAVQYFEAQGPTAPNFTEVVERLDVFGFVNLSGTEHLFVAVRPFDEEEGRAGLAGREFTSYDLKNDFSLDGTNADIQSLFFEGDLTEIFPELDIWDFKFLDYRFSVGRQPMSFQRGLLINEDMIDAVTVTRNTLNGNGLLNGRMTAVYAWNRITRLDGNFSNSDAKMYGMFSEWDFAFNTLYVDVGFLDDDQVVVGGIPRGGDMLFYGISSTQRFVGYENTYNTRFHVLGSIPTDGETLAAGEGTLLFSQMSWTPHHGEDLIYCNAFWAIDRFTSPARAPLAGGPLGDTGLLFAGAALGRFGSAINNLTNKDAGASLGYQMFFCNRRQQATVEVGGKKSTDGPDDGMIGLFFRSQTAVGQHWIIVTDAFLAKRESSGGSTNQGARLEFLYSF